MGLGSDLPPLTRRTVLRVFAVAAVGLLAGCRSSKQRAATPAPGTSPATLSQTPAPTPTVAAQPTLTPDELLAKRVAIAETELVGAYDTAASQHPELASLLAPFRADHAAHADALVPGAASPPPPSPPPSSTLPVTPSSAASASTASPSGASPSGAAPSSAPPPNPVLIQLADAERSAATARIDDLATTTGSLASLLASIGGCEAAHAALLATARSTP